MLSWKEALNLFEATKVATEKGPVNSYWDEDLINKVIDILQTHPVSITLALECTFDTVDLSLCDTDEMMERRRPF